MRKKYLLLSLFTVMISFVLFGCVNQGNILKTPELIQTNENTISWNKIDEADSYELNINGQILIINENHYVFDDFGTYDIKIRAIAKEGTLYNNSLWGEILTLSYIYIEKNGVVMLDVSYLSMVIGEFHTLIVKTLPENNDNITFSSNHPNIATVNNEGVILALSVGEAEITVSVHGYYEATCYVNVESLLIASTGDSIIIEKGDTIVLDIYTNPKLGVNDVLFFESNDPEIAFIGNTGVLTGLTPGKTNITITSTNGGTYLIDVTVTEIEDALVTFIITVPKILEEGYSVYLVGAFNQWLPLDDRYKFVQDETNPLKYSLVVTTFEPKTDISYKYILGTPDSYAWETYANSPTANLTKSIVGGKNYIEDTITLWQDPQ